MSDELLDLHINLAQRILKEQFFHINGLESTLLQGKKHTLTDNMAKNKLQIIHCLEQHHWITCKHSQQCSRRGYYKGFHIQIY